MQYLVTGVDAPTFGESDDLHGVHQDYMDGWAGALIARGPSLSPDGTTHTGSIHVVDLPDPETARRFARDEPYARAGWFSTVTVSPIVPCLDGTMWDRPAPAVSGAAALVTSSFTAPDRPAADLAATFRQRLDGAAERWIYLGVLCSEAASATGVMALIDDHPAEARRQVATVLDRSGIGTAPVQASRWRRGGRSAA